MHIRPLLLAGAAAALLSLGAAAPALASDNANGTPLYINSRTCGGAPAASQTAANQQGFVNFHLDGQTVTVIYHVKDGAPDATYSVFGYEGYCGLKGLLGSLTTNNNGVANATFTYTIDPGQTQVWTFSEHSPYTSLADFAETPLVTP